MGLLSHINSLNQHKGGLLARAELLEKSNNDFCQICASLKLLHTAVFEELNGFYYIKKASGIDGASVASSVCTKDFLDGLVKDSENWNCFESENLTPFYQLFSREFSSKINSINITKLTRNNQNYYFAVFCLNNQQVSLPQTDNSFKEKLYEYITGQKSQIPVEIDDGFNISSANLLIITVKLAVDNLTANVDEKFKSLVSNTIFEMSYQKLKNLFSKPNCAFPGSNFEIKTILFSKEEIDEKLLQFHISSELAELLGNESNNMLLLTAGSCPNAKGAKSFLQQG